MNPHGPAAVLSLWRRPASRAADALLAALRAAAAAPRRAWLAWQAARRRALALKALRELSPAVLRDIGAPEELIGEAQRFSDRQALLRDSIYYGR